MSDLVRLRIARSAFDKGFLRVIKLRVLLIFARRRHDEKYAPAVLRYAESRRRVDVPWAFGLESGVDRAGSANHPKASAIDRRPFHFITFTLEYEANHGSLGSQRSQDSP